MISVVLATHNEAKMIEACLRAVSSFVDEIIVVDGESTDDTVAKAEALGAKVIATTNKANFHINKQMAIDHAQHDLILQLDADEVVDSELIAFITQLHTNLKKINFKPDSSQPVAWWIRRRNFFMGSFLKKGGQYPDPVIRLFIKGKAHLPQKDVHEQMKVDGVIGWAEGHLLHYGNPSFSDYMRKFNTYTSFKASQLADAELPFSAVTALNHLVVKPLVTFLLLFVRHKGFLDGVPGLIFAVFSGLHHAVAYSKYWEMREVKVAK